MGILQNANREFCGVFRIWGGTVLNSAYPQETVGNRHLTGNQRNITVGEGINNDKVGVPIGLAHPAAWIMPGTAGMVASQNEATGTGTMTGAGALGKNGASALTGTGTVGATARLVVSGTAALSGTGTVSANVVAALAAAADLAATGNQTAAITALGWAVSALTGTGTLTGTRYATGELAADIAPPIDLEAAGFSTYLLDSEDVETGMTLRQCLRILLSMAAGKVSGAGTSEITFRDVNDTVNRIVATVDANGNREAITIDVS